MTATKTLPGVLALGLLAAWAHSAVAAPDAAPPPASAAEAITAGRLILEMRGRYEFVDQTRAGAIAEPAEALTVRTRLGWETAAWIGVRGLVELEDVQHVGPARFAVNTPGATTPPLNGADKARFPAVNDPDVTELNRLQLTWKPSPVATVTVGRQRILIDDQRFVGNAGWRQDEQTFDAARLDGNLGAFSATYAYLTRINRVLGDLRDWRSDSHLFSAAWSVDPTLRAEVFVYALDFSNSPPNSSLTRGVKFSGNAAAGPYRFVYDATWARQSDYRHATSPYDLDYWGADVAGSTGAYTVKASYEWLQGNGTRGFTTPLATTHAFQGWADAWVQPLGGNKGFVDGLKDFNLTAGLKPKLKIAGFANPDLLLRYHDFEDQRTGARLAHEWDAQVLGWITPKVSLALKYADFQRVAAVPAGTTTPPASRTKIWLTLEYRY